MLQVMDWNNPEHRDRLKEDHHRMIGDIARYKWLLELAHGACNKADETAEHWRKTTNNLYKTMGDEDAMRTHSREREARLKGYKDRVRMAESRVDTLQEQVNTLSADIDNLRSNNRILEDNLDKSERQHRRHSNQAAGVFRPLAPGDDVDAG